MKTKLDIKYRKETKEEAVARKKMIRDILQFEMARIRQEKIIEVSFN